MAVFHLVGWEVFEMPEVGLLTEQFMFALLSTFCFEFVWAKCATLLGPVSSTVGFTSVMLPTCMVLDFVIWPDPDQAMSERYLAGMILIILSFSVISLAKD